VVPSLSKGVALPTVHRPLVGHLGRDEQSDLTYLTYM
jgi:hypothetical protein